MAKCFLTGIELPIVDAYILDIAAANRVIRELRDQLKVMERVVEQFSPVDLVEVYDPAVHHNVTIKQKRLVCTPVVETFRSVSMGERLFIPWPEWRARKKKGIAARSARPPLAKPCVNLAVEDGNDAGNNG